VSEVAVEREGAVARLRLQRPPLNILTPSLIAELGACVRALHGDPSVRVAVLSGEGRSFSAGVEVETMRDLDPARARLFIEGLHRAIEALGALDAVTVARLHGHVLGGALELVLACDIRIAALTCRLGMPEIRVGIPSVIEAALLPGLVGWGRTAELLLLGDAIEAAEAERWGLLNRAVPDEALDREVDQWVARLLARPPRALRRQKALLRQWRRVDLESAMCLSMDAFAQAYTTDEPRRSMQAFLDRPRAPRPAS
jgi:enoyl-CoA hydratase/carnithine racemase